MNSCFKKEKQALVLLLAIFAYYLLLKWLRFSAEYQSIITTFFWLLIAIYVYFSEKPNRHSKLKFKEFYLLLMLVCAVLYLVSYFLIGTIDGFGLNIYDTSAVGIAKNLFILGAAVIMKEWVRNFLINTVQKRYVIVFGILIILIFSFTEVNLDTFSKLKTIEDWLSYMSKNVLPVVFFNIFMTVAAYILGFYGTVIYATLTKFPIWIVRILPNFRWITLLLVGALLPMMFTIVLRSISKRKAIRGKRQEMKQASPYSWIATSVVAILTVWFALGIFPIFPTAIVSDSMKPDISRGDIVLIQKVDSNTLKEQDVILYALDNIQVFHRIVKIEYFQGVKQFTVKGDNNKYQDPKPVVGEQIIGKHIATIPYIGWPGVLLQQRGGDVQVETGGTEPTILDKLASKYIDYQTEKSDMEGKGD
jgi:signal peptidase I